MALSVGSKAPEFSLATKTDDTFELVKLSQNFWKRNTLLLFFPMAFTSVGTSQLCSASDELNRYQGLDTAVYGISGDSPFALQEWALKEGIRVSLLSDFDHSVAKAYEVAYESFHPGANLPLSGVAKRSAFIVDRQGVIQYAESSDDPRNLPDLEAIRGKAQSVGRE
jgi:glutaredoxin-dependent peroxiredoxin